MLPVCHALFSGYGCDPSGSWGRIFDKAWVGHNLHRTVTVMFVFVDSVQINRNTTGSTQCAIISKAPTMISFHGGGGSTFGE